jgi:hypothetical protein
MLDKIRSAKRGGDVDTTIWLSAELKPPLPHGPPEWHL